LNAFVKRLRLPRRFEALNLVIATIDWEDEVYYISDASSKTFIIDFGQQSG